MANEVCSAAGVQRIVKVGDYLAKKLPATSPATLTAHMKVNLVKYESLVRKAVAAGRIKHGSLVTMELDRGHGMTYDARIWENATPTLKTLQNYMFVMSTADLHLPRRERAFFRWLLPYERHSVC